MFVAISPEELSLLPIDELEEDRESRSFIRAI